MVRKGDGTYRFCIDFRRVNQVTSKDAYPMPNMTSILDSLRQARYLTKIDLKQAFLQVPIADEKSREVTSFIVPGRGLYRFKVMPFGLTNAPATFQRLADEVFGPELFPFVVVFLDDILVCTPDFTLHCKLVEEVFRRLRESGLRINLDKCEFGCKEVRYLGYLVNSDGMGVDPEKVSSVTNFPTPKNVKDLRRFLGMAGWYRRFIEGFSTIVSPLTSLLKKKVHWLWSNEQEDAFQALKRELTSAPVLARPDFELPFTLQTDASQTGLGAVLTQVQDGEERVIAYSSRSLSSQEQNYTVTEKECLAVLFGIERNNHYLEGYEFSVVTDHASLKWLLNLKNPTGRLARWALRLQAYNFEIEYRKGSLNCVADALSRISEISVMSVQSSPSRSNFSDEWYERKLYRVSHDPDNHPDWRVENGQLYYLRKSFLKGELADPSEDWKLVVPWHLRKKVLHECHDDLQSGHLGVEKTHWRVGRLYYWPGLYKDILRYVRHCSICQRVKPPNVPPQGIMYPRYVKAPWELVSTDIMGPFPRSSLGNVYLVVFKDVFSKWVELVPIRKATSEVIMTKLRMMIINRFGVPQTLLTDNATNFVSNLVKSVAESYGIKLITTPYYHSQANPTERANRNIRQLIVTYLKENHQHWDKYIGELQFALNSAVHDSTKYSPAFLNYGRELNPPICLRNQAAGGNLDVSIPENAFRSWRNRLVKLKELHHLVEKNLLASSTSQCHRYNLRRRPGQFRLGDQVLRRNFQLSSAADKHSAKLCPKFEGPFRVTGLSSGGTCELVDESGRPAGKWHPSKLKLYLEPLPRGEDELE